MILNDQSVARKAKIVQRVKLN